MSFRALADAVGEGANLIADRFAATSPLKSRLRALKGKYIEKMCPAGPSRRDIRYYPLPRGDLGVVVSMAIALFAKVPGKSHKVAEYWVFSRHKPRSDFRGGLLRLPSTERLKNLANRIGAAVDAMPSIVFDKKRQAICDFLWRLFH